MDERAPQHHLEAQFDQNLDLVKQAAAEVDAHHKFGYIQGAPGTKGNGLYHNEGVAIGDLRDDSTRHTIVSRMDYLPVPYNANRKLRQSISTEAEATLVFPAQKDSGPKYVRSSHKADTTKLIERPHGKSRAITHEADNRQMTVTRSVTETSSSHPYTSETTEYSHTYKNPDVALKFGALIAAQAARKAKAIKAERSKAA